MSLDPYTLPMEGKYRLIMPGCNTHFPGARFVDGVTVEPVNWRDARRIALAWGVRTCTVEFWSAPDEQESEAPAPDNDDSAVMIDDLDLMGRPELFGIATDLGLEPHHRAGARKLREMIRDARSNVDD